MVACLLALRAGRLAGLATDALAFVLDALALVWFGRALLPDVRGHLAHERAVDAGDRDLGLRLGRQRDAFGRREHDRVRVAELEDDLLAGALERDALRQSDDHLADSRHGDPLTRPAREARRRDPPRGPPCRT